MKTKTNPKSRKKRIKLLASTLSAVVVLTVGSLSIQHLNNLSEINLNKSNDRVDKVIQKCYISCKEIDYESYGERLKHISNDRIDEKARLAEIAVMQLKIEQERVAKIKAEADRKHKEELEKERLRRLEEKKNQPVVASRSNEYKGVNEDLGTFNVSWYGADCEGCSGQTSSGVWVNKSIYYKGYGVAASDWSVIPPYSIIEVEGYGRYIVLDKGGAIKNKRLDLLTTSEAKSSDYGRQQLNVTVLRWGNK